MSAFKLADTVEIPVEKAQEIIDKFFSLVPDVRKFLDKTAEVAKRYGFMVSPKPYNRIRWFPGYENRNDFKRQGQIEREGKNMPMQSGNADMLKLAMVNLWELKERENYPVKFIIAVYDEIQTECLESFAEEWKEIMNTEMVKAADVILKNIVPMKVDCEINDYWTK